jgi:predicted lactoylglutathione lyase
MAGKPHLRGRCLRLDPSWSFMKSYCNGTTGVAMAAIETLTPILRVEDLEASRHYYTRTLGFSLDWDADTMISVSRDGQSIMLCERAQGQPGTWLWIGVEDADSLFGELVAKGARIRSPPQNFSWAYEFQVEDPDGHVLRFGGEPKAGPADGVFKS